MTTPDPMPLQSVTRLDLAPAELRIALDPAPPPGPCAETLRVWERMRAEKPRLFNGPISTFARYDESSLTIHAGVDTYQRLTVQPEIDNGVMQLSVTGVLTATDALGAEHALLAKRSPATRVYPSMWELAPSGGFDPPPSSEMLRSGARLDGRDAWRQLLLEMHEELGADLEPEPGRIVAITTDRLAYSTDIVFRCRIAQPMDSVSRRSAQAGWEYEQVRWLPLDSWDTVSACPPESLIPPSRALLMAL